MNDYVKLKDHSRNSVYILKSEIVTVYQKDGNCNITTRSGHTYFVTNSCDDVIEALISDGDDDALYQGAGYYPDQMYLDLDWGIR